jgi:hypothetical protein
MPKAQTHKKRATLIGLIDETRRLGEIQVDNVMELCDCSDSGARKYLKELFDSRILIKLRYAWCKGGNFGPRIYGLTNDDELISQFIEENSPGVQLKPLIEPTRTASGYFVEQAKVGIFAQFCTRSEQVKIRRDPLVACLFGPAA